MLSPALSSHSASSSERPANLESISFLATSIQNETSTTQPSSASKWHHARPKKGIQAKLKGSAKFRACAILYRPSQTANLLNNPLPLPLLSSTMANPTSTSATPASRWYSPKFGFAPHRPAFKHRAGATILGATMWFWIFYRASKDGPVLLVSFSKRIFRVREDERRELRGC